MAAEAIIASSAIFRGCSGRNDYRLPSRSAPEPRLLQYGFRAVLARNRIDRFLPGLFREPAHSQGASSGFHLGCRSVVVDIWDV